MTASVVRLPTSQTDEPSDQELIRRVQSLPRDSAERNAACEKLVTRNQSLVG